MSQGQVASNLRSTSANPNGPSSSQTRRRSIRPRQLSADMRQRLARLGLTPASNDTKRENLQLIVNRLTADLNNYRAMANHWQKQCVDIKHADRQKNYAFVPAEAPKDLEETLLNLEELASRPTNEVSSFNSQLFGRLDSTANPSLSMFAMGPPKVHSDVSRLVTNSTFRAVLHSISIMSSMESISNQLDESSFPCMDHVKPDFNTSKVLQIWNDIFEPMSFQPSTYAYDASPSCRRIAGFDDDDADVDHFDKVLANATDLEIVDMLQYITLLVGGMHQVVFDDPSMAPARLHLGRSCERILREVIFTRNLTTSPELATSLMDGLLGTFCHFATHGMASAVLSVLNLTWMIFTLHSQVFLPTMRIMLGSYFLVAGPENQRSVWLQRIAEGLELSSPTSEKPFPAILMTAVAEAYGALLNRDESTLLRQTALLDDILAPGSPDSVSVDSQTPSSNDLCLGTRSECRGSRPCSSFDFEVPLDLVDVDFPSSESSELVYPANDENLFGEWKSVSEEDWQTLGLEQSSSTLSTADTNSAVVIIDTDCMLHLDPAKTYLPGENLKALNRIILYLIRADASLAIGDYDTCRSWVDEAEKTLVSIPLEYMYQRVFLMKNVIKTTCPFPTGERSVVDEFERRLLLLETKRSGKALSPERLSIGVLWRTP